MSPLRSELVDLINLDLLGPKNGPTEEVAETHVHDRYLVGMLAPPDEQVGEAQDDDLATQGENDTGSENGKTESATPRADSLFPASIGTTFVVASDHTRIRVHASWGQYLKEGSETLTTEAGNPKSVWKRHPRGGPLDLPLSEGRIKPKTPDATQPEVIVEGIARRRGETWIVTLFLVNKQPKPESNKDEAWLFQVELAIDSADGAPIFRRKDILPERRDADPRSIEDRHLAMLYRREGEFAVGHGTAVRVDVDPTDSWRARRITTSAIPAYEVRQQTPRKADDPGAEGLGDLVLDMKLLAEAEASQLQPMLQPLADAYATWIDARENERDSAGARLGDFPKEADETIARCRESHRRIQNGIDLLAKDSQANDAFRFANRAMWLQRIHSQVAEQRRRDQTKSVTDLLEVIDSDPKNRSWFPFQLAFVLLNLPALADPKHKERGAIADLLWFPTGGGKTEAYLGLSAFTMAMRRLQGTIGARIGDRGMAVLMRYTLRLLTVQQFQRAAALICACEVIRRETAATGNARFGLEPFRIGLWVGKKTSPNTTSQSAEVVEDERGSGRGVSGVGSPAQLTACPWCGTRLERGRHLRVDKVPGGAGRTLCFCSDPMGRCPFSEKQAPGEGIPAVVVDEEIYRRLPDLVVATVDKFAQMAWNGQIQMLFGQVDGMCPRHGFVSPETNDNDSHNRSGDLPAVKKTVHGDLRPPDLIIQDELHLISGPLGSLVGLYETAIEELCTWRLDGVEVRPKVIASTATVRNAAAQVRSLFVRQVEVFPSPGTDAADNFFSLRREPEQQPGRLYLGICAPGRRLKVALIRAYQAVLAGAQVLYERDGAKADPWMTLVGYFNSLRELGGMKRLVDDDITNHIWKMDQRGLAKRRMNKVEELTSRRTSTEIPDILDLLEVRFDPNDEARRKQARKEGKPSGPPPIDVLLATNMVSVGVDVKRLGLMVVGGQPKTTAEYIQATSRVGRSHPGLVLTVYNWARPRDLSHYERFEHYHATFYRHVESLSVTPFALGAVERGLSALLVSLVRQAGPEFNANVMARRVRGDHAFVKRAIEAIVKRAETVLQDRGFGDDLRKFLRQRLDDWAKAVQREPTLAYDTKKEGAVGTVGLLNRPDDEDWRLFTCPNSLREVEPSANVLVDEEA